MLITVHNEGPPIPEAEQRWIFEPLKRGGVDERAPRTSRSLGLGLYIACEIAEAHHGTLVLGSSNHEGTAFVAQPPRTLAPTQRPIDAI